VEGVFVASDRVVDAGFLLGPVLVVAALELTGIYLAVKTGRLRRPRWSRWLRRWNWPLSWAVDFGSALAVYALASVGAIVAVDAAFHHPGWEEQMRIFLHSIVPLAIAVLVVWGSLELAWLLGVREPPDLRQP
jgi:hypothetical protein